MPKCGAKNTVGTRAAKRTLWIIHELQEVRAVRAPADDAFRGFPRVHRSGAFPTSTLRPADTIFAPMVGLAVIENLARHRFPGRTQLLEMPLRLVSTKCSRVADITLLRPGDGSDVGGALLISPLTPPLDPVFFPAAGLAMVGDRFDRRGVGCGCLTVGRRAGRRC